jgi:membrane protein DedA with SNARE-associated domain
MSTTRCLPLHTEPCNMDEIFTQLSTLDVHGAFLLASVGKYAFITIFIAVLCFGEGAILIALLLSQQGVFQLEGAIVASVLGYIMADLFWFLVGRYFPARLIPHSFRRIIARPLSEALARVIKDKIFIAVFFLKFFMWVRLAIIVYLAQQPLSFIRFLAYDIIGTIIYVAILTGIAVMFGSLIGTFSIITTILSGFFLIIILSYVAKKAYLYATGSSTHTTN